MITVQTPADERFWFKANLALVILTALMLGFFITR